MLIAKAPAWGFGLLAIIVVAIPFVFGHSPFMDIFVLIGIYAIILIAFDLLLGYSGQFSLGHNGFFAIGAYGSAILTLKGMPFEPAALLSIVLTCVVAVIVGAGTLRLEGFYLAISTFAFGIIVYNLLLTLPELTGGGTGLTRIPRVTLFSYVFTERWAYYALVWLLALATLWLCFNIANSKIGLIARSIKGDEVAARSLGVNLTRYKLQIFVFSAGFTALGGVLYAHYQRYLGPSDFSIWTSVEFLLMLFLGGQQTLWGPIIGVALLKFLPYLLGPLQDFKVLIYGVIVIVVIRLMPLGIAGWIISVAKSRATRYKGMLLRLRPERLSEEAESF